MICLILNDTNVEKAFNTCFSSFEFVENDFNILQYAVSRAYWREFYSVTIWDFD